MTKGQRNDEHIRLLTSQKPSHNPNLTLSRRLTRPQLTPMVVPPPTLILERLREHLPLSRKSSPSRRRAMAHAAPPLPLLRLACVEFFLLCPHRNQATVVRMIPAHAVLGVDDRVLQPEIHVQDDISEGFEQDLAPDLEREAGEESALGGIDGEFLAGGRRREEEQPRRRENGEGLLFLASGKLLAHPLGECDWHC